MTKSNLIRDIDFEISSLCNAGCSVCMRRRDGHFTEFNQTYWKLEDVKNTIDVDIIKNLLGFNICGNFGDAMTNPDIVKIIEWIRSINKKCSINIRTNGGVGSPDMYASLAKHNVIMSFGIDGVGTSNELYRVNVKWDKLFENLKSFSENAESYQIEIQFLLWSETSNQLLPIIDLAQSVKCGSLYLRKPYTQGEYTEVYNMKGESTHFLTELKHPSVETLTKKMWTLIELNDLKSFIIDSNIPEPTLRKSNNQIKPCVVHKYNPYTPLPINYTEEETNQIKHINKQTCYSKNRNDFYDLTKSLYNIYITHNKLVMPCCMLPPYISNAITHSTGTENSFQREILNRMYEIGFDNFSLEKRTLREIMDSGVLDEFVYKDLENNKQFGLCKIHCGKC
jgi:sulfatase maturation enzyme AslB (radical SAM superfamily)